MAITVTSELLRELAGFRADRGCAISVYLSLDPRDAPTAGDVQTRVHSVLDEAAKSKGVHREELSHDQREALKTDFERIRRYFEHELDREGARGAAVFCAGLDGRWTPLTLADSVEDAVRVGHQFYLAPLVPLLDRGRVLVAHVSRKQGHVYRLRGGRLEEIVDHSDEQPRRHDQGGSQARHQRHIEHLVQEHLRGVAAELDRLVRTGSPKVVLVSTEEMRTEFEGFLSHEAQRAVTGWTSAEAHAGPTELLEAARPVIESSLQQQENETLERWREESARDGRAASGWTDTLEAASDGRVDVLLISDGAQRPGWRCAECGRVSGQAGDCPLDGAVMEEDEAGIDLAIHQTLAHGGTPLLVRYHPDLEPVEGIGALLRY